MIIVGIDPGRTGGLAILERLDGKNKLLSSKRIERMSDEEVLSFFEDLKITARNKEVMVVIEEPYIKPNIVFKPCPVCKVKIRQTTFQAGVRTSLTGYGKILGLLAANRLHYVEVESRIWKTAMKLSSDKQKSFDLVAKLYPDSNLTLKCEDGVAEAILIAHYASKL